MCYTFIFDSRLKIELPKLYKKWTAYEPKIQSAMLEKWERVRSQIPERITEIEEEINIRQERLDVEQDFETSCQLNSEISELASIINDLWIWYRTTPEVTDKDCVQH